MVNGREESAPGFATAFHLDILRLLALHAVTERYEGTLPEV